MRALQALARQLRAERRGQSPPAPSTAVPAPPALTAAHLSRLAEVRRAWPAFAARLAGLDASQLASIVDDREALVVRAPVGSGKTTVLVHRAVYLHLVRGVPWRRLAIVTFTTKAAAEVRARLVALLSAVGADGPAPDDLWLVGTFHAVARALLARALPVERLGLTRGFQVLDEAERDAMLRELVGAHRLRVGSRRTLPRRLRELSAGEGDLARLAPLFAAEKRARDAVDFDDLLAHATTLLRLTHPGGASAPTCLRAVLVDELQDCEPRDLAFVHALRSARRAPLLAPCALFAVGDPDQAIYGWRGGAADVFSRVQADLGAGALALARSHRSTAHILDAARAVLGASSEGRAPVPTRAEGAKVAIVRHHDVVAEGAHLAARIAALCAAGVSRDEIAILVRLRAQAEALRRVLEGHGVPCAGEESPALGGVRLLTFHASKGLEFRCVFLSGVNDGVVPLRVRAAGRTSDAEERRLLFVALTRARDAVEVAYHARPDHPLASPEVSRLLRCLPPGSVDWQDAPAAEPRLAPASEGWSVGQTARHPRYGRGVITRAEGDVVACDFGKLGVREFPAKLCPLVSMTS